MNIAPLKQCAPLLATEVKYHNFEAIIKLEGMAACMCSKTEFSKIAYIVKLYMLEKMNPRRDSWMEIVNITTELHRPIW